MKPDEVRTRERKDGGEQYVASELTVYGKVERITEDLADQGGGLGSTDSLSSDFIAGPGGGSPTDVVTF